MVDMLLLWVDSDTSTLPMVIRAVVMMDPFAVPKASKKTPPKTGKMVLTMETLDWSTPYSELVIPNSSLMMFFIAPSVCAAKWLPTISVQKGTPPSWEEENLLGEHNAQPSAGHCTIPAKNRAHAKATALYFQGWVVKWSSFLVSTSL